MNALKVFFSTRIGSVGQDKSIQELNELQLAHVGGGSGIVVVEVPPPPPAPGTGG